VDTSVRDADPQDILQMQTDADPVLSRVYFFLIKLNYRKTDAC